MLKNTTNASIYVTRRLDRSCKIRQCVLNRQILNPSRQVKYLIGLVYL